VVDTDPATDPRSALALSSSRTRIDEHFRKRVEEIFGWSKTATSMHKTVTDVGQAGAFHLATAANPTSLHRLPPV